MSREPVGVVIDVDPAGHLTVTVAGVVWAPPSADATGLPLGRTDVPWVLDRLLSEHDAPLDVVLHDGGRTYTDLVLPEDLKAGNPSFSTAPPGFAPDRHLPPLHHYPQTPPAESEPSLSETASGRAWFEAGGYTPGEQVAVWVVVTRLTADERGVVGLHLPPALGSIVGEVVAIGEESGETYRNQAGVRGLDEGAVRGARRGQRLDGSTWPRPRAPGPTGVTNLGRRDDGPDLRR